MIIDGINFNVVYIDPSIETAGDGTTPSTAYKDFPTLVDNTCYLVRRTNNTSSKFYQGSSNIVNLLILGMPKADDPFYDLVPSEAKSAWNDNYDYANIYFDRTSLTNPNDNWTNTNMHYCVLTAVKYINIRNCRLHRINSATQPAGPGFMFSITSTDVTSKCVNCHFGCNYLMINSEYAAENSMIPATYNRMYGQYITYPETNSVCFDNCVIDCAGQYDVPYTKYMTNFSFRNSCKNFLLKNCIINHFGFLDKYKSNYDPNNSLAAFTGWDKTFYNTEIINNTFYDVYQNNRVPSVNYISFDHNHHGNCYMYNNTLKQLVFKDYVAPTTNINNNYNKFFIEACKSIDIENFTADFTNSAAKIPCDIIFKFSNGILIGSPGIVKRSIKNVDIKFYLEDPSIYRNDRTVINLEGYRTFNANYISDSEKIVTYYPIIAENINIETSGIALECRNCNIISGEVIGNIKVNDGAYVNLDKLTNKNNTLKAVNIDGSVCGVRIKELDINNMTTPQILRGTNTDSGIINGTFCIVDECSVNPFVDVLTAPTEGQDQNCIYLCNNFDNGKFYARNSAIKAESYSVVRTGSNSTASLKLSNNTYSQTDYYLELGSNILQGFNKELSNGTYNFETYIASYGLNYINLIHDFIIEVDVPKNDGSVITYSSQSGVIVSDTSSWNDENVTAYKVIIPNVEINNTPVTTTTVNIRIKYKAYSTNGYLYVDPDFKFIVKGGD